jgi:hypothetical protein
MDYLDPRKQLRHRIIILVGYVLIAIAIAIGTIILLQIAYGFGIGKNGAVIQNELTFFSSQPHPASIYANGQLESKTTNTRLTLPAGIYHIKLTRDGYRDWQRTIELDGGGVEHFDYPLLFPKTLTTKKLQTLTAAPGLATQSPDRRWFIVERPGSMTDFDLYDLKNPAKAPVAISLPAGLLTKAAASESWQLGEWADDSKHVLLQHSYDGKIEFILLDRANPDQSLNLDKDLSANPAGLTLKNKKYDQYYLYDAAAASLQAASLKIPSPVPVLQHVLAYKSYGNDTLLYATSSGAPAGKVLVKLRIGDQTSAIRPLPAGAVYLLDLTKYSGVMYVAVGDNVDNKVYVFKDPAGQLAAQPDHVVVPAQVLHVPQPNYVSFSDNAQFIVASNGNHFGVYDIENETGYNYSVPAPLDPPQVHATWMDGDRLVMVSSGKLLVFDYDGTNQQSLMAAGSSYVPAFAPDYKTVYALAPAATPGQLELTQTFLLTAADR